MACGCGCGSRTNFCCGPALPPGCTTFVGVKNQIPSIGGIQILDNWIMPAIGATVTVTIGGRLLAPIGTHLWSQDVGYLEITGISVNGEAGLSNVTIKNNGNLFNDPPGTAISAYNPFILTDPPPT